MWLSIHVYILVVCGSVECSDQWIGFSYRAYVWYQLARFKKLSFPMLLIIILP